MNHILFWPESLQRLKERSHVVGWVEEDLSTQTQRIIAAFCVPIDPKEEDAAKQGNKLQEDIAAQLSNDSYPRSCCSNESPLEDECLCAGCQRAICLDGLRVLGVFDPSSHFECRTGERKEIGEELCDFYPIRFNNNTHHPISYPWYRWNQPRQSRSQASQQLVLYDDSTNHSYIYCCCYHNHIPSKTTSRPTPHWILRINNAPLLQQVLTSSDAWSPPDSQTPSRLLDSTAKSPSERVFSPTSIWIPSSSLFLRQLYTCYRDPSSWYVGLLVNRFVVTNKGKIENVQASCMPITLSKTSMVGSDIQQTQQLLMALVHTLLGLALSGILLLLWPRLEEHASRGIVWHFQTLQQVATWLEDNPLGIKVNRGMATVLGQAIQWFLDVLQHAWLFASHQVLSLPNEQNGALNRLVKHLIQWLVILGPTLVGGMSGWLAFVHDVWALSTSHLWVLAKLSTLLFRFELHILTATWCLFRGKKRNILRNRVDSMEYDATQLLLGSILFAVALFLLSTFVVFQVVFAGLAFLVKAVSSALEGTCLALRRVPMGILYFKLQGMLWFPDRFYLDHVATTDGLDGPVDITCLRTEQLSITQLLQH